MSAFDAENYFYQHCAPSRLSKFLAHAKLYELSLGLPGHFVEAGVFKGASFCRFRKLGSLFHPDHARRFIGFDVFGTFPAAQYEPDKPVLDVQVAAAGSESISRDELLNLLKEQGLAKNVELIQGDIVRTLPDYLSAHPEMSFSIVNIDLDLYEPIEVALRNLFPRVVKGGVVILDDYEFFPGAKKAVDEYLMEHHRPERIQKFPFSLTPCYMIKDNHGL